MVDAIQGLPPVRNIERTSVEPKLIRDTDASQNDSSRLKKNNSTDDNPDSSNRSAGILLSKEGFEKLAEKLKPLLEEQNLSIEFAQDFDTKKMIMKIINNETDEVIKQLPPEVSLKIARIVSSQLENGSVTNAKI